MAVNTYASFRRIPPSLWITERQLLLPLNDLIHSNFVENLLLALFLRIFNNIGDEERIPTNNDGQSFTGFFLYPY